MDITQQWYSTTMKYARKNYEMGWDFFVEGVDYNDFKRVVTEQKFVTYDEVFDYYCQLTVDRLEAMEEASGDWGFHGEW